MIPRSFSFGDNWTRFAAGYISDERISCAVESLASFVGSDRIRDKTVVDLGCGSGLSSLAAVRLGAKRVVSVDIDEKCLTCTNALKEQFAPLVDWSTLRGSVLDREFITKLGTFDLVYSWGVLHHTGAMWAGIENAAILVHEGGYFCLAIYNKADGFALYPDGRIGPSWLWEKSKRMYVNLPRPGQFILDSLVFALFILFSLLKLENPISELKTYSHKRGMSLWIDIKDWLGGYPYQYASVEEIFAYLHPLGFTLQNIRCNNGLLNNEYLFQKRSRA